MHEVNENLHTLCFLRKRILLIKHPCYEIAVYVTYFKLPSLGELTAEENKTDMQSLYYTCASPPRHLSDVIVQ
jgi:hypothetical protein